MRGSLVHIADLVLNRPLLVTPQKAAVISQVLSGRLGLEGLTIGAGVDAQSVETAIASIGKPAPGASRFAGDFVRMEGTDRPAPYQMTKSGAAIITTTGSLVNRGAWVGASSGLTSYEGISYQLKTAANDSRVKAIVLDLETPGGQAVGAFELGALVRKVASVKPVYAVVNGMAASAGYALASGATKIVTTPSGVSGSIGVVLLHADMSKKLESEGITPTLIFAGAHKVDGNSLEPLSAEVKAELQAEVDTIYDKFVRLVYENRGSKISLKAIRETEGRTYIGEDAVKAGLADSVGTFDDVLSALSSGRSVGRNSSSSKGASMLIQENGGPGAENAGHSKADLDAARADGHKAGKAEGHAEGAKAANDRFSAILSAEGVKGKERIAMDLALKSPAMDADAVVSFVAGLEAPKASASVPPIAQRGSDAGLDEIETNASAGGNTPRADNDAASWGAAIDRVLPSNR